MYIKKRYDYCCNCFRNRYKSEKSLKCNIVFGVVTCHYISRTKNKYAKLNRAIKVELAGYQIHKKLICPDNSFGVATVSLKFIAAFQESSMGSQSFIQRIFFLT